MAGATGIAHYIFASASPIGLILGGRWGEDINVQLRGGIGGVGVNVPGAQLSAWRGNYIPVNDNCLVDAILRASYPNGAMTAINAEVGDDALGLSSTAWQAQEATLKMEAEAPLEVDLLCHLLSGHHTRTAGGGDHSGCAKTTFEWFRGHGKIGAANAGLRRLGFTVRNNLVPFYSLNQVAAGSERFPEYGNKGNEMVTLDAAYLVDPETNLTQDEMQTIGNVVGTCINNAGSPATITITAATPQVYSWETGPVAHDQLKMINYAMGLDPNSGSLTIAIA